MKVITRLKDKDAEFGPRVTICPLYAAKRSSPVSTLRAPPPPFHRAAPFAITHQSNAHAFFGCGNLPFLPLARAQSRSEEERPFRRWSSDARALSRLRPTACPLGARVTLTQRDGRGARRRKRPADEHEQVVTDRQYGARSREERTSFSGEGHARSSSCQFYARNW